MKKKIRFIINPISGIGKKKIIPGLIQKHLNHSLYSYDIIYTEYKGHAKEISRTAVTENIDIVCVAGGDGSVNETASSLINTKTALAILPVGSGNGVARHLKLPLRLKAAIERINQGNIEKIDTYTLNGIPSIGISGFGFDALIAKRFDEYSKRGLLSYAKLVIKEYRKYKGINIVLDKNKEYKNILFCSIANTSQFGNNVYVSPMSSVKDGEIEVVMMKLPSFFQLIPLLILSLRKKVHQSKFVEIIKVKSAEIKVENRLGHIDGDPVLFEQSSIEIKCNPKSLYVVM